ncbi:MAG: OB-fold domain-containing protein [Actinomycetota bacterium]|nr:OB-fold domain-containing protein [Actinomycetota bacterium]
METGWLLPDLEHEVGAEFWHGCGRGELLVQACAACGKWRMPPRPMCPACRSTEIRWDVTSGRGRIWSYVVPHPPLLPAYADVAPYNAIIVELEEDPMIRFAGNLVTSVDGAINEIDPATIQIGEPVRVVFTQIEEVSLPRWVRASQS